MSQDEIELALLDYRSQSPTNVSDLHRRPGYTREESDLKGTLESDGEAATDSESGTPPQPYPRRLIASITVVLGCLGVALLVLGLYPFVKRGSVFSNVAGFEVTAPYLTNAYVGQAEIYVPGIELSQGGCQSLRKLNIVLHLLLNVVGVLILGFSSVVQQLLTSELFGNVFSKPDWENATFGNNSVGRLFKRGRALGKAGWILMILTSLPAHAFINSILTLSTIRPSNNGWNGLPSQFGFNGEQLNTWFPSSIFNISSPTPVGTRTEVDIAFCQYIHQLPWRLNSIAIDPIMRLTDAEYSFIFANFYSTSIFDYTIYQFRKDVYADIASVAVANGWSLTDPNTRPACYANVFPTQCALSIRPEAPLVVGIACILKAVIVLVLLLKDRHFREPSISCIGDAILAVALERKQLNYRCLSSYDSVRSAGAKVYIPVRRARFRMLRAGDWVAFAYWALSIVAVAVLLYFSMKTNQWSGVGEMLHNSFTSIGMESQLLEISNTVGFSSLGAMALSNLPVMAWCDPVRGE